MPLSAYILFSVEINISSEDLIQFPSPLPYHFFFKNPYTHGITLCFEEVNDSQKI